MSPNVIGMIVFASTIAGALLGLWLRTTLPDDHLQGESRDAIQRTVGLIATMTALVLGLVIASAKSSFDAMDTAVKHTAMDVLALDRLLARYGPETREIREALKQAVARRIDLIWPQGSSRPAQLDPLRVAASVEGIADRIRVLMPRDDLQRSLQSRAVERAEAILQTRWIVSEGSGTSVLVPFLVILGFWLTITFTIFGLLARRNATVVAVLSVCALSVGSAVFIVLEMDGPFEGLLKVSADPLRYALSRLNQ